jgi:isopenicillin N synthase-like dioxygenase
MYFQFEAMRRAKMSGQIMPIDFTAANAGTEIAKSFKEVGFVVVDHHPIGLSLIEEVHEGWRKFFSSEQKNYYLYDKKSLDGYFPFGLEKARMDKGQDLKEFYYFYPWGKCPDNLKSCTLKLHSQLFSFAESILLILDKLLPDAVRNKLSEPLLSMIANTPRSVLRILHYPPLEKGVNDHLYNKSVAGSVRAIEHEDLTLLSVISQIIGSGLQVKDLSGRWYDVPAGIDKLAINIGDMLAYCTRGFYKATTHRVVNPTGVEATASRFSNAFFLNPRDEVQLDENHTALSCLNEHIKKKLESVDTVQV